MDMLDFITRQLLQVNPVVIFVRGLINSWRQKLGTGMQNGVSISVRLGFYNNGSRLSSNESTPWKQRPVY